ncbi:MAG: hypothetical protein CBD83_004070 [Prochlorococcus sp. TMED223]|nr:MAG: hypothetical protein CBD83_004070 [Prochlorococcus sp. TMED223]
MAVAKSGELNCSDLRREQELIESICLDVLLVKDRCSLFPYISRNQIGKVSVQSFIDYIAIEIQLISSWNLPLLDVSETSHLLDTET